MVVHCPGGPAFSVPPFSGHAFYHAMHFSASAVLHVVRPSVCPFMTLVDCDHTWKSWKTNTQLSAGTVDHFGWLHGWFAVSRV